MNWCQPHWDLLRQAVSVRGLSHLGAQDGHEVVRQVQDQFDGADEVFDPLMGSYWRINLAMTESLQRMGRFAEILEFKCPLCILVDDGQPEMVDNWINGVTDQAKVYAIELGLIKADG